MVVIRTVVLATCLLTACAVCAQEAAPPPVPDVVYKGLVGKALDAVPMDPEKRVVLQRTNAVVSNTLTARSLAVWAGYANPMLLVAGVAWGIYAALNIKAPEAATTPDTNRVEPVAPVQIQFALLNALPAPMDSVAAPCPPCTIRTYLLAVTDVPLYEPNSFTEARAARTAGEVWHQAATE